MRSARVRCAAALLAASLLGPVDSTAKAPDPRAELLRLGHFILPASLEARELWAFTPVSALIIEEQVLLEEFRENSGFVGAPVTFASTSRGWLLGTSHGVYEVRLNDRDLLFLPELQEEGVYRFEGDVAFTDRSLYRLSAPWERHEFDDFDFADLNEVLFSGDTLTIATRKGLRRLLWELRTWDDAPLGGKVEKEQVVRFLPQGVHNEIDEPDSVPISTPTLLVGEKHVFYLDTGASQWLPVEGLSFQGYRRADSDSCYRHISKLLFQASTGKQPGRRVWERWLVSPTGVCRLQLPDRGVPAVTAQFPLSGDARCTFVDSIFVWVGTTEDLYVIDREYEDTYRFFEERNMIVWGILGRPREITYAVKGEERGWYAMTQAGMTEVFTGTWTWDAYGVDEFLVKDVLCATSDVDGFWVGTRRGIRWFNVPNRRWDSTRAPDALKEIPVYRLEWFGKDLFALAADGVYSSTLQSRSWVKVASVQP